jgi:hypothetical protein
MLFLFFEAWIVLLPQATGRSLVYVCTLGQVRCEDDLATIIGVGFILALLLLIAVVILRA